jgi:hypothetical protein
MKLLPLYSNSVLKSDALIGGNVVVLIKVASNCTHFVYRMNIHINALVLTTLLYIGSEMSSDDRSWLMQTVLGMDIASTVSYFYPRLIPVVSIYCGLLESVSLFVLKNKYIFYSVINVHFSSEQSIHQFMCRCCSVVGSLKNFRCHCFILFSSL